MKFLPFQCWLLLWLFCTAGGLGVTSGCAWHGQRTIWRAPDFAVPDSDGIKNFSLVSAEDDYARAVQLEETGSAECVQHYYRTAAATWMVLQRELKSSGKTSPRSHELHRSSLAKLLITAQKFHCWDPCRGLLLDSPAQTIRVPVSYQGFAWSPPEFQRLLPVGDYKTPKISRAFRESGLGVPLVVERHTDLPQPFMHRKQAFAATAAMQSGPTGCQLVFYDPLRFSDITVAGCQVPLARDLSAPFAIAGSDDDRRWIDNFLQPGATGAGDGLKMIEPYQPGKIPVVFVHGLLSDPATWADLANELRAHPDLNDRYQWWAFEYKTGEPFLTSAAVLRQNLVQLRSCYDPCRQDSAMSQMVLVGHSMGGIVAKLQVTHSDDQLWNAAATQPLSTVATTPQTRQQLREAFYFRPSVDITRIVYIGTPHLGSSWARRPIGRLGSALVQPAEESESIHDHLVVNNPTLFREELRSRFPTSVDLLKPESKLLTATASLHYSSQVKLHSIIGEGQTSWRESSTDGVVPVTSARLVGVQSERIVDAKHAKLHRNQATIQEIVRILKEHLQYTARQ